MNTKLTQQIIRIILWVSVLFPLFTEAQIRYVDASRPLSGAGTNWGNAYKTLAEALTVANSDTSIKEIRVAEGTYYPTGSQSGTNRDSSFVIYRGNLRLLGGYPSGGGTRNYEAHPTILSGDIGTPENNNDNSHHVLVIAGLGAQADSVIVEGVSVVWGTANAGGSKVYNGQSIQRDDAGGVAIYGNGNGAKILIMNCKIQANRASDAGAGIFVSATSPTIVNTLISGNHANYGGGAMNASGSNTNFINVTIAGNRAGNSGGAMRNSSSEPVITNTIIYGNNSGISNNNASFTHAFSLIQGQISTANGNLNGNTHNPMFENPSDASMAPTRSGDYRLQATSPCIDMGNDGAIPAGITTDLAGNNRYSCHNDMGTYERQKPPVIRYVKQTFAGSGDGSSWDNASNDLQHMLNQACPGTEIWVAQGTYKPWRPANNLDTLDVNRNNAFVLKKDVKVYGGFAPTGSPTMAERNWNIYPAVLSGDIGTVGNNADNCYHVVISSGDVGTAELNGFTVTKGYSVENNASSVSVNGSNVVIERGAGIAVVNSSPLLQNLILKENQGYAGAATGCTNASPVLANVLIADNISSFGAVYNNNSSPEFYHTTITNNTAIVNANNGIGMRSVTNSAPKFYNSVIWNNRRADNVVNNIANGAGNTPFYTCSDIQGSAAGWANLGTNGGNNIDADPLFVDISSGNYRLQPCSPAANAGNNAHVPTGVSTDLDGNPRIYQSTADMGAYEFQDFPIFYTKYVRQGGSGDGSSWNNASGDLQLMLNQSCPGTEIWVAQGTYKPNRPANNLNVIDIDNRNNAFVLKKDVKVYGGFAPTGNPTMAERNWNTYPAVLSGDIGTVNDNTDNVSHVVIASGDVGTAELNGFTVTAGNATLASWMSVNGNYIFSRDGGGMYNYESSPVISHCIFSGNTAMDDGGGMHNTYSSPTITNSTFSGNTSMIYYGGGMYNIYSSPTITNSTFSGNKANSGGDIENDNSYPVISNSIFGGSSSTISNRNMNRLLFVYYSILQGGYTDGYGINVIDADPLFVNPAAGDYRLQPCSPAVNAGNNARVPAGITTDLDGNPRVYQSTVDMGAYEFQGSVYIDPKDSLTVVICASEAPYLLGNNFLTESGIYTEIFTAVNGCDSTVILNLEVLPVFNDTVSLSICVNEFPYHFGSQSLTQSGIYTEIFTTVNGCDSAVTLVLEVLPVFSNAVSISICANEVPYLFGTQSLTEPGVYTEIFTTVNGCDSIVTLDLEVLPVFSNAVSISICASEAPYLFGNQSLTQSGNYTEIFTAVNGCDSTVTLDLEVLPVLSNAVSISICASEAPYLFGNQSLTQSGIYTEIFTAVNGCDSTVTLTLEVLPVFSNAVSLNICANEVPYLFGSQSVTEPGVYTEIFTTVNGCDSTVILTLEVLPVFNDTVSLSICVNEFPYHFGSQSLTQSGIYTEIFTTVNGCDSTVTLALEVLPVFSNIAFSKICANEAPYLFGNQSLTQSGIYTEIFTTVNGCDSTVTLALEVLPVFSNAVSLSICASKVPYLFGNQSLTESGIYTEIFTAQNGCDSTVTLTLEVLPVFSNAVSLSICANEIPYLFGSQSLTKSGIYTEIFTAVNGCDSTVTLDLKILWNIIYVDSSATGTNNGSSWANAYTSLADAILAAHSSSCIDTILVAKGTYYPEHIPPTNSTTTDRDKTFYFLRDGLAVLGGYPSGGGTRDWDANPTILSGDLDKSNTRNNNDAYHVILAMRTYSTLHISGITVTGGNADGSGLIVVNNANVLRGYGSGMYIYSSSPTFANSVFSGNKADVGGGGMYNSYSSPTIINSTFSGNTAATWGGGMHNFYSIPTITNSIFSGNKAALGGDINYDNGSGSISNSIFWGSSSAIANKGSAPVVSYSIVQGGYPTGTNITDADPLFVNAPSYTTAPFTGGDYTLQPASPAINAGHNDSIPAGITTDLAGNPRIRGCMVDMGAYEYQGATGNNIVYVDSSATGINDGSSWANAYTSLAGAVLAAHSCTDIDSILVAKGTYYPEHIPPTNSTNITDRNKTFYFLRDGLAVLGGYPSGGGTTRDWNNNLTILSGDIGTPNNSTDNAYHVVMIAGAEDIDSSLVLDGFSITAGNADDENQNTVVINGSGYYQDEGSGMYIQKAAPVIRHCTFTGNYAAYLGGGMSMQSASSLILHCTFSDNIAGRSGGGIFLSPSSSSSSVISHCIFSGNTAAYWGGGIYNQGSRFALLSIINSVFSGNEAKEGGGWCNSTLAPVDVVNTVFYGNTATENGGGVHNSGSSIKMTNVTISGNTAPEGAEWYNSITGYPVIRNSVIWGNGIGKNPGNPGIATVFGNRQHSLIQGLDGSGTGNIDGAVNPLFINPDAGDYRLQPCSPAINAGDNSAIPSEITTDILGNPRIAESTVDIGAYENRGFTLHHTANSALNATGYCQTPDGWRHYYHDDGTENKVFVSVHPNGQNLGAIYAGTVLQESYNRSAQALALPYTQPKNFYPFNRSWTLESENTFGNPVSVRFYFNETDSMDVSSQMVVDSLSKLILYKVDGNDVWNIQATGYKEYQYSENADTSGYIFGKYQDIRYAEFQVTSFSTGTMAMTMDDAVLPLDLLSFTASAVEDKTHLQWHTVNEENVSHFGIERSSDARNWETISTVTALNGIEQHYDAWDGEPLSGINYYRLKMTDFDGTYKYSKIVEVSFGQESHTPHYRIYPNPNKGRFIISAVGIEGMNSQIQLHDGLGRLIFSDRIQEGTNQINLRHLVSGIYYLSIAYDKGKKIEKIIIE